MPKRYVTETSWGLLDITEWINKQAELGYRLKSLTFQAPQGGDFFYLAVMWRKT